MENNLCIAAESDTLVRIYGAFMHHNIFRNLNFVVLYNSTDRCNIEYPFYTEAIETLILHSMRWRAGNGIN